MAEVELTQSSSPPDDLSTEWRRGTRKNLSRRRAVVGLSLFNVASMSLIALYQVGLLKHAPEPKLPGFDADAVNGSKEAYSLLDTPDAVLAVGSYASTAALSAMGGGSDRPKSRPWLSILAAAKAAFDAVVAVKMIIEERRRFHRFCLWCLLSAAATVTAASIAVPEAGAAIREIRRKETEK